MTAHIARKRMEAVIDDAMQAAIDAPEDLSGSEWRELCAIHYEAAMQAFDEVTAPTLQYARERAAWLGRNSAFAETNPMKSNAHAAAGAVCALVDIADSFRSISASLEKLADREEP